MKIIKESKQEKLPIEFITQFVSKGWDEVGNLKASIEGIKKEFAGTKEVEKILQDLVDAYLIAIGQLELHLDKKDYVELPEKEEVKESLKESSKIPYNYQLFDDGTPNYEYAYSKMDRFMTTERPEDFERFYEIKDVNEMENFLNDNIDEGEFLNRAGNDATVRDFAKYILDNHLNEDLANPPEKVEKINDGNKVELHTELPDYNVEVEQKGKKVEVEVEPKDEFDDSELAMSDKDVKFVDEPFNNDWPEFEVSDAEKAQIEAEKAAIADNIVVNDAKEDEIRNETEVPEEVKAEGNSEEPVFIDAFDIDFDEPIADPDSDNIIKNWKQFKNN